MTTSKLFPIDSIDLCAQEVRVTASGLRQLAEIAVWRSRVDAETALREIQDSFAYGKNKLRDRISQRAEAEKMEKAAKDLAFALRFLSGFESLDKGERTDLTLYPDKA